MNIADIIRQRHSVRQYTDRPIDATVQAKLTAIIQEINAKSQLNIRLITDEPQAFDSTLAHYGKFRGVRNYFAMTGPKSDRDLDEKIGYYGEQLVLKAQELGLNTCWVALTFKHNKEAVGLAKGEKLVLVIAVGYGTNQGAVHKIKSREQVMSVQGEASEWFLNGVDAALLAPTAMNQQKFKFILDGNQVEAKAGLGFYAKVDLGIVKYHFELGAGTENFTWKKGI